MNFITNLLQLLTIEQDKANHFIYGLLIFIFCSFIFNPFISFFFVISVGGLKEVYDHYIERRFDWLDLFWTGLGGLVGLFLNIC